jgi:hypothetical protein
MAELVDAPASGAGTRKGVEVRVLFWAPFHFSALIMLMIFLTVLIVLQPLRGRREIFVWSF